jgi:hypothetical protein
MNVIVQVMENRKTLVEYIYNENTIKITRAIIRYNTPVYRFIFTTENTNHYTIHSEYKTLGRALKKFNKAVDAIKNGTQIK